MRIRILMFSLLRIRIRLTTLMRIRSTYHPDADPDSDFLFAADLDSTYHPDADPFDLSP
jgi:hypothetical protein